MKKKIINGILMVALLAATTTSFVSCKDNDEDVKTDLIAQLNKTATDLENDYKAADTALENSLKNWVAEQDYATKKQLKDSIADVKAWVENQGYAKESEVAARFLAVGKRIDTLGLKIDTIKGEIADLQGRVDKLEPAVDSLKDRMGAAEDSIKVFRQDITNIVETLKKMVTSVTVNATSTNILANSKVIPGINMQFLGAAFGQAAANGAFPSADAGDYVKGHGVALDASDIKGVEAITWNEKDYLPIAKGGKVAAGTVYFTINPSNVKVADLKGLSLVNSKGNASFVTIEKESAEASKETLSWGITRGEEFATTLWEAPAIINLKDNDLATIDPTEIIDFKGIAKDVRSLLSELKQDAIDANRSNYEATAKSATKAVIKTSAQIVAEVLQAKIPALPALAMKATWADTVGTRSVLSDYSIAATAYKPLSFTFGNDLIEGRQISLDRLDNAFARIINKIRSKVPANFANVEFKFNFPANVGATVYTLIEIGAANNQIKTITISSTKPTGATLITNTTGDLVANGKYYTEGAVSSDISTVTDAIKAGINLTQINNMINEVNKLINQVNSYADRSISFEQRVSNFLEKELNRVITKVATDGLTRVFEPIILFQLNDNYAVNRFFDGTTIPAGNVDLIPTTMTYELLAPAYKKYVAVKKANGEFAFQKVLTKGDKDFNKVTVKDLAAGNYTVIYSAVDFSGKQIAKKYNIVVK